MKCCVFAIWRIGEIEEEERLHQFPYKTNHHEKLLRIQNEKDVRVRWKSIVIHLPFCCLKEANVRKWKKNTNKQNNKQANEN